MRMVRRESNKRRNVFRLRKMRVQHGRRHVMSVTAVYVEQRRVDKTHKHSGNSIAGRDFPHGGTILPLASLVLLFITLKSSRTQNAYVSTGARAIRMRIGIRLMTLPVIDPANAGIS